MTQEPVSTPGAIKTIDQAIKDRHSVRTFTGPMTEERHQLVLNVIEEVNKLPRPFSTNVSIGDHPPGLGTLMVISNDAGWLLGLIPLDIPEEEKLHAKYDVSFLLHAAVLKLTQNDVATVWIGGTFNEKLAEEHNPGMNIPVVIAYGEDAKRTRLLESAMKFVVGSKKRYDLEKLFYDLDNQRPFTVENAGENLAILQAVQSCPSAMNIQAWRLVVKGNEAHLFNASDHAACAFDIGIAIATMTLLLEEKGHKTKITNVEDHPQNPIDGGVYICTLSLKD